MSRLLLNRKRNLSVATSFLSTEASKAEEELKTKDLKPEVSQNCSLDVNGNNRKITLSKKIVRQTTIPELMANFVATPKERPLVSILKYGSVKTNNGLRSVSLKLPVDHVDKTTAKSHSKNRRMRKRAALAALDPIDEIINGGKKLRISAVSFFS